MINRKLAIGLLITALLMGAVMLPSPVLAADCPCTIDTAASGSSRGVGDASNSEFGQAQTFISPGAGVFSGFKVTFSTNTGSPSGSMTWTLYGDYLGQPGAAITSGTFTPVASSANTITVGGVSLNSGALYWLAFTAGAQSTDQRWNITASNAVSTYSGGVRYTSTNGGTWVVGDNDLALVITIGAVTATNTPTATSATATPADTATPTITPSPTANYLIQVTSTAGAPIAIERTATFGDITVFIGELILAGLIFTAFAYTFWKKK